MSAPTRGEIRQWGLGLGLPVGRTGALPQGLVDRWNREHPDAQFEDPGTTAITAWQHADLTPRYRRAGPT